MLGLIEFAFMSRNCRSSFELVAIAIVQPESPDDGSGGWMIRSKVEHTEDFDNKTHLGASVSEIGL
jgi:hypothetical protein